MGAQNNRQPKIIKKIRSIYALIVVSRNQNANGDARQNMWNNEALFSNRNINSSNA
jgi:hypothetical protein